MDGFLFDPDHQMTRREFLKLTGLGALSLFMMPGFSQLDFSPPSSQSGSPDMPIGRVLENRVTLYDSPTFSGKFIKMYWRDLLLPITDITIGDDKPSYNRVWYQMNHEGYVHSGSVQPVKLNLNPVLQRIPEKGQLAEVTVPYTDAIWNPKFPTSVAYRFYYSTTHWIVDVKQDDQGKFWYLIPDDQFPFSYFVDATHMRPITAEEISPLSSDIPMEEKRLEIRLNDQVVVAFEGDIPVFMTRVATGARFSEGDFRTPPGRYITNRKRPSRHMADGGLAAPKTYDLPGVPWVCYLTRSGISFHGTYWHNDFGKPRSHGCINCLSTAARWIYRWTTPVVPVDSIYWREDNGTVVDVFYE
ncbi:MAG: L,D-transpeptidase [Anaerolineae bacterium]|nr:L,D-transpeptidase [Anaerolineae bacterium]